MTNERFFIRDCFEESDLPYFEADGKVGLLATVNPEGLPHVTLITAMQATDPRRLIFGQFCEGRGKRYAEENRSVGFLLMSLDKRIWRGTARWTGKANTGADYELMNRKPMWRYNSYFGIHTVHYLDLVSVTPAQRLSMSQVVRGVLSAALNKRRFSCGNADDVSDRALNPWTQEFVSRTGNLKFAAYVGEDGYPRLIPQFSAACADGRSIFLPGVEYSEEIALIPDGAVVALFALSLDMEDVLTRGTFRRTGPGGVIDVDWVYNSMPPVAERIFPPNDLAEKVFEFR